MNERQVVCLVNVRDEKQQEVVEQEVAVAIREIALRHELQWEVFHRSEDGCSKEANNKRIFDWSSIPEDT